MDISKCADMKAVGSFACVPFSSCHKRALPRRIYIPSDLWGAEKRLGQCTSLLCHLCPSCIALSSWNLLWRFLSWSLQVNEAIPFFGDRSDWIRCNNVGHCRAWRIQALRVFQQRSPSRKESGVFIPGIELPVLSEQAPRFVASLLGFPPRRDGWSRGLGFDCLRLHQNGFASRSRCRAGVPGMARPFEMKAQLPAQTVIGKWSG